MKEIALWILLEVPCKLLSGAPSSLQPPALGAALAPPCSKHDVATIAQTPGVHDIRDRLDLRLRCLTFDMLRPFQKDHVASIGFTDNGDVEMLR